MTTQAEDQLRGALAAQDKRILDAGQRVGLYFGTDTPERMADEIEALRAEVSRLTAALDAVRRAAENVINTVSHAKGCTVVSRSCNCWKARLRAATRQPAGAGGEAQP